ncbi:ALKB8 protein, partial [Bucco capensis]|nr:ALKB8 protein [Bucco capensis]
VGCDRSTGLVQICAEKSCQALVCDALAVPIRTGACDACISIAVLHHFSTAERRVAAIRELTRLLRPGGRALLYVWAMEQEYNHHKSKYLKEKKESKAKEEETKPNPAQRLLDEQLPATNSRDSAQLLPAWGAEAACSLPVHTNRTSFQSQDVLVPWHLQGSPRKAGEGRAAGLFAAPQGLSPAVLHRYYHVFCAGELEAACRSLPGVRLQSSYYDQGNWCVLLEKL